MPRLEIFDSKVEQLVAEHLIRSGFKGYDLNGICAKISRRSAVCLRKLPFFMIPGSSGGVYCNPDFNPLLPRSPVFRGYFDKNPIVDINDPRRFIFSDGA
jgi:hypothetical protein